MFVTTAYAQTETQQAPTNPGDTLIQFLPFVLIFVVFYFLLLRPQQVKIKQQKAMLDALQRGDEIVTAGGVIGKVQRVDEKELLVEIAEGVKVRVLRATVTSVYGDKAAAPAPGKAPKDT